MSPQTCRSVIGTVVLALLLVASLSFVRVRAQPGPNDVQCYTISRTCSSAPGQPLFLTREDCCLGDGLSYSLFDDETCNLCVVFGFSRDALSAPEQGESYPVDVGYLKGTGGSSPLPTATNVQISANPISAAESDFTIEPRSFNFISEFVSRTVQVNFRVDAVALEPNETFTIGLTAVGLPFGAFLVDSAEFTIIDGDVLELSFTEDDYRALEPDLVMPVVVTKNSIIASDITLTVTPLTVDEAEALGIQAPNVPDEDPSGDLMLGLENTRARSVVPADFIGDPQTITFLADEGVPGATPNRDIRAPITIFDDDRDEPDEEVFVVSLSVQSIGSSVGQDAVMITRDASLCRIADDDPISIGFELDCYTVEEAERAAISDLIFLVRQNNRTTERGFFLVVRAAAVAPPGASTATLGTSGADGDYSVGTASGSVVLTFASDAEDDRVAFLFTTFDDQVTEGLEAFQLTVEPSEVGPTFTPPDGETVFQNTFVKINDNDIIIVGYESNYTVAESTGSVEACISVTFPSPNDTILNGFLLVAGTEPGTADATDFVPPPPFSVTPFFDDMNRRRCFNIAIINDTVFEDPEMFSLTLVQDTPDENIILMPDFAFVTILDSSEVVIGFSLDAYDVNETDGNVTVTVEVLQGQLDRNVSVVFSTTDIGDATDGPDYTGINGRVLTFSAGVTSIDVDIPIIDDGVFEIFSESFIAMIDFESGPIPRVFLSPNAADINILDNDEIVVGFLQESYEVDEGSTAMLDFGVISGELGGFTISIDASSEESGSGVGFATGGDDFTEETVSGFTLSMASPSVFEVSIEQDNDTEGSEVFRALLDNLGLLNTGATPPGPDDLSRVSVIPDVALVTILDDDAATVGFLDTAYTVNEDGSFVSLRIGVISGCIDVNVSLNLSTQDVTAMAPFDYTALSDEPIVIPAKEPGVTVRVEIVNDTLFEDTEIFLGILSNLVAEGNADVSLAEPRAEIDIVDDENLVIGFDPVSYVVNETAGSVELTVRVLEGQLADPLTLRIFNVDQSAEAPGDYIAFDEQLQFQPGQTFTTFTVDINDDNAFEIDETFFAQLELVSADPSGRISIAPAAADVTILDNDEVVIGFDPDSYTVSEASGGATLTARVLEGDLQRDIAVLFTTSDDSATAVSLAPGAAPGDYDAVTMVLLFGPSDLERNVTVPIVNDVIFEGTERFFGNLGTEGLSIRGLTLQPDLAEVIITDDDDITIGFSQDLYDVPESTPFVNITVELLAGGPLEREVTVVLDISAGTAMFGSGASEPDFDPISGRTVELTFGPGVTSIVVPISVIDDERLEPDRENFFSDLSLSTADPAVILNPATATVEIIDDDVVVIGFDVRMATVDENAGTYTFTVVAENGADVLRRPVTVEFTTDDGSAIAGSDYGSASQTLVFDRDNTVQTITVDILNDNINEALEQFFGRLSTLDPDVRFSIQNQTVNIVDDDEVFITFDRPTYMYIENAITGTVIVQRIGDSSQTATVMISGALQEGLDPARIDQELVFGPDEDMIPVEFDIQNDNIALEELEILEFALMYLVQPSGFSFGDYPNATVEIMDDDILTLTVRKDSAVSENDTIEACILFDRPFAQPFNISSNTSVTQNPDSVDATPDVDYAGFSMRVLTATLDDSDAGMLCFEIEVFDDDVVEDQECFDFSINLEGLPMDISDMIVIAPGSATVTCCITDNDRVRIGFDPVSYVVDESAGSVTLVVRVLEGQLNRSVEVTLNTGDISAIAPGDYLSVMDSVLQFDSIQDTVEVTVQIANDNIFEFNETFSASLTTADSAVDLDPMSAEVLITDDDAITIGFDPEDYTVNEADGSVTLNVAVLEGTLAVPVTVLFETVDGTATSENQPPADYTSLTTELTFDEDTDEVPVVVSIVNDDIVESIETFFAVISNNLNIEPDRITIAPEEATVTIIEDNNDTVRIGFEEILYEAEEGDTEMICVVLIEGTLERDVTVTVTSSDDTAEAGLDYNAISEDLVFSPGTTRLCVDGVTLPDGLLENLERFDLSLTTSDPQVVLDPDEAVFEIIDSNTVVIGLEETEFTVQEGEDPLVMVCVRVLDGELRRDVEVLFNTVAGTAIAGMDFDEENVQLIFNEDNTRICVNITITNDDLYENTESFGVELNLGPDEDPTDVTLQPDTAEITILDNNELTFGFEPSTYDVPEGDAVDLCVRLLSGIIGPGVTVDVGVNTQDVSTDNSATEGDDYTGVTETLIFTDADQVGDIPGQCVQVTTLGDDLAEGTEIFEGMLSLPNDDPRVTLNPDLATVNIIDQDAITIGFINPPYFGTEDDGFITVTVGVTGGILTDSVAVTFQTEDQAITIPPLSSATVGVDFVNTTLVLNFDADTTSISFNVTVLPDDIYENDEAFIGTLSDVVSDVTVNLAPDTATLIIEDDDGVTIGLEETAYTVDEEQEFVEVCAILVSGTLERNAVVTLATSPDSAESVLDFEDLSEVLVFVPDGPERICRNITIVNDDVYEVDEDFNIGLTTDDDNIELDPDEGTVTITDNDELVIGWEQEVYTTSEGSTVELCAVVIEGSIGGPVPPISAATRDGTANSDPVGVELQDYVNIPDATFNFNVNTVSQCIEVTILADDILEPEIEDFFADLSFSTPVERVTLDPDEARVDIIDDDEVTIGFRLPEYTGSEDSGEILPVVAVLDGSIEGIDIVVGFSTEPGTATAVDPADYTSVVANLTFNDVDVEEVVRVPVIDDVVYEFTENLFGNLVLVTQHPGVTIAPPRAELFIEDNDGVTIGFEMTEYTSAENSTLEVCAIITEGILERSVDVTIESSSDGTTATPDLDYTSFFDGLIFDADTDRVCVNIPIFEDDIVEGNEDFTVNLNTSNPDITLDPPTARVTIIDEGEILIRFEEPSYTFVENELSGVVTVVRTGDSDETIMVRVVGGPSTTPGIVQSASAVDTIISFPPGVDEATVVIMLTNDNIGLENVEVFDLRLETIASTPENVIFVNPNMTRINVLDDDEVVVGFGRPTLSVNEDVGEFMMCVVKNIVTLVPVTVEITSTPLTATENADYNASSIPTSVIIPANDLMVCFTGGIIDDEISLEDDEDFRLNIISTDPTVTVDPEETVITIIDTDVVTVTFEQPIYTTTEDAGTREICIVKDLETAVIVNASYFTTDGSALDGLDYLGQVGSVELGTEAGARTCFEVTILPDDIIEPRENFTATLQPFPIGGPIITGDPDITTVIIVPIDDTILVNDTVIGDPLYIVPILVSDEDLEVVNNRTDFDVNTLSLCYEIHGSSGDYFNFVSDECISVNAQYVDFDDSDILNVVDEIAIRAHDTTSDCREISVGIDDNGNCEVNIDGNPLTGTRYERNGISVMIRRMGRRVRVSVPNCDGDISVVMYVTCEQGSIVDPYQDLRLSGPMIRFDVMRGLNTGHMSAHGLIGQFWNVPVRVTPFVGVDRFGDQVEGRYVIDLPARPGAPEAERSLTGFLYPLAWDFDEEPCLYVGNRQGGPIHEVRQPNDGVIESFYKDYIVASAFDETGFPFALFNEERCGGGPLPPSVTTPTTPPTTPPPTDPPTTADPFGPPGGVTDPPARK